MWILIYKKAKRAIIAAIVYIVLAALLYGAVYQNPFRFVPSEKRTDVIIENSALFQDADIIQSAEGWQVQEESGKKFLISQTKDPKIFCKTDKADNIYLDIQIDGMSKNHNYISTAKGEIYYSSDDSFDGGQKVEFELRRGHNIIQVPVSCLYTQMRIDLVSEKDITLLIQKISISNYFKLAWLIEIAVMALLLDMLIIAFIHMSSKKVKTETKAKKIFEVLSKPVKKYIKDFKDFFRNNRSIFIWTFLFVIFSYGLLCAYYTIYIDEERQIIEAYAAQGWIAQGRFGNYLFERIFLAGRIYTSFFGDAAAALLIGTGCLIQCYHIYKISGRSVGKMSQVVYCGLAVSVPYVCGAYMVVGIYNIEISLAVCFTNLAAGFIFAEERKSRIRFIYAVFLLLAAISIYQAFVPLFAVNIVLYCLIYVELEDPADAAKKLICKIISGICVCTVSLMMYMIINQLFIRYTGIESDYLDGSFWGWGKGTSVSSILIVIMNHIRDILIGSPKLLFGGIVFKVTFGLFVVYIIVRFIKNKKNRRSFLFLAVCSLLMPFSLNFAVGSTIFAGRTLLGLPYLIGIIWILIIEKLADQRLIKGLFCSIACYLIVIQVQYINQYFLADFKRYQQDQIISQQIIDDIRDACAGYTKMPLVPVGTYDHEDNGMTMHYELAGSYFTVDGGSIERIVHFMQAQGYNVDMPSSDQIADSYQYIHDMPCWPVKGSVKNVNGYVIVKLSEPAQRWIDSYVLPFEHE